MNINRIITLLTRQLAGEASATELTELEQILANDAEARAAADRLKNYWDNNPPVDSDFLEATYLLHVNKMDATGITFNEETSTGSESSKIKKNFFAPHILNQMVVALTGIGIIIYMFFVFKPVTYRAAVANTPLPDVAEVATQAGTRTKLLLPDGTKIWLNSGSKITYKKNFNDGPRAVDLVGEAYFDIFKNPNRPFIIHTATIDVSVTGTVFNVKAYQGDATAETSPISGNVEVLRYTTSEKLVNNSVRSH